jgi:hypothetical protein
MDRVLHLRMFQMSPQIPMRLIYGTLLAGLLLWPVNQASDRSSRTPARAGFTIKLETPREEDTDKALVLTVSKNGIVRDLLGHQIRIPGVIKLRPHSHAGNPQITDIIIIQLENEEETPVAVVGEVLCELRATADPQRETVVYLYLVTFPTLSGQ